MGSLLDNLSSAMRRQGGLRLAYVFGSARNGDLRPSSDVDLAVRFCAPPSLDRIGRLVAELEAATGRRVDLIDVDRAPPLLLREIVVRGTPLLVVDPRERVEFETRALARYQDTTYLRRVQDEHFHRWAEAYRAGRS